MKWLLRFYPRIWRERYEEEMLALLEQHHGTWRTAIDLFRGGWETHFDLTWRRQEMRSAHNPPSYTLAGGTLMGLAGIVALLLYGIISYPGSIQGEGLTHLILLIAGLLAYTAVIAWSKLQKKTSVQIALAQGTKFGVILGCGAWVNMALEHFAPLGPVGSMVRGIGMWALMFVSFGAAGSVAYQRSCSLGLAMLSAIWSALISTVATLIFGFALSALFMPSMQHILAGAYAQSGMSDPRAFVIRNTLDSASTHLLLVPVLACLFGLVGAFACSCLGSLRPRVTKVIGVLEICLLLGGLAALRYASVLARPERPPFVMTGLLALGIAMACAHPVFTAVRRPNPSASPG